MKNEDINPLHLVGLRLASLALAMAVSGAEVRSAPKRLKLAIVQMAPGASLEENRDRIISGISETAGRGARAAVFPEGALRGSGAGNAMVVTEAVAAIRQAARDRRMYVLFGGFSYLASVKKEANWMRVLGPDGGDLLYYEKLYDNHRAAMPGLFEIDGIPCSAMICADRWLRGVEEIPIQEGAQISFELSNNFCSEWVAPFEWYWYVPRALRHNVWVVFANSGNRAPGQADALAALKHGHSAIIAPGGQIAAATRGDSEVVVMAEIDPASATRAETLRRGTHPVLHPFWEAGVALRRGEKIRIPAVVPVKSEGTEVTLAVGQAVNNFPEMEKMIRAARQQKADLIAFPARAADGHQLNWFQQAARDNRIMIVFGMAPSNDRAMHNSAFVIGLDGEMVTRYDQLSASSPFEPGTKTASMWFHVKGVPAVVTVGHDSLWSELAELAAVAGAQIHVHLDHDPLSDAAARLRRLQIIANMASYRTFTLAANVVDSMIWDDLRGADESRAEVRGLPQPDRGRLEVYSPFSANLVARAGEGRQLLIATRRIPAQNSHHPRRTSNFNPQMDAWYSIGARMIRPPANDEPGNRK